MNSLMILLAQIHSSPAVLNAARNIFVLHVWFPQGRSVKFRPFVLFNKLLLISNRLRLRQNDCHFSYEILQMNSLFWKCFVLWFKREICCQVFSEYQTVSYSTNNELAPNRRKAIILTNDGQVRWRIDVSLALHEWLPRNGIGVNMMMN